MKNQIPIQIITRLLEVNNDRVIIYSLVKNEIIYDDLKLILAACIKSSLLFSAQLMDEKNSLVSNTKNKIVSNQEFFNVWLVINECLLIQEHERIYALFSESENVIKTAYDNALNKDNLKHLSFNLKNLLREQKKLLKANKNLEKVYKINSILN